jgi:hypothetical protein
MRRRALDATLAARLTRTVQVGVAYDDASGVPFTRIEEGIRTADQDAGWIRPPRAESPGAQSTPGHRNLDLVADWRFALYGMRVTAFAQLRTALGRTPASTFYLGYRSCDTVPGTDAGGAPACVPHDEFAPGLPRLPVAGFRLAF